MKKIHLLLILALVATSCDLNLTKEGYIDSDNALIRVSDAEKFRNDIYLTLRDDLFSGAPIYVNELLSDNFHASITFGNRNGEYYKWEMRSTFGNVEELWKDCYYAVTLANYLTEGIGNMNKTSFSEEDIQKLNIILGEAAFLKAIAVYVLAERFCGVYDSATASTRLGVILLDEQITTPSDPASYAGRSSLAATYEYIDKYLKQAESALSGLNGKVGSVYITKDAVTALKARVALTKKDYETAISASTSLINSGTYPLIDNAEDLQQMWVNDSGAECIVQLWADLAAASLPNTCEYGYTGKQSNGSFSPNYMPEKWIIDLYSENDIRKQVWFSKKDCIFGTITGNIYICTKFSGNPDFMTEAQKTGVSNYINKIKLFRIAEQYLIAAEAYAQKGDAANANHYLNALRMKRIIGDTEHNYSGDELLSQIKNERAREFYGEGFRYLDVKRWGKGMARSEAQDNQIINNAGSPNTEFLAKDAHDPFWLWPIPQSEIDANPQIRDQQNPGY